MGVVETHLDVESQIDTLRFTSLFLPASLFSRQSRSGFPELAPAPMKSVRSETAVTREVGWDTLRIPAAGRPNYVSNGHVPISVFLSPDAALHGQSLRRCSEFSTCSSRDWPISLRSNGMATTASGVFNSQKDMGRQWH